MKKENASRRKYAKGEYIHFTGRKYCSILKVIESIIKGRTSNNLIRYI